MKSVRLLPVVVLATAALLIIKATALFVDGSYILTGTQSVQAQQEAGQQMEQMEQEVTEDNENLTLGEIGAADRASETLFSRAERAPVVTDKIDAIAVTENKAGDKISIGSTNGSTDTEKAVLERLSDRRSELEQLARELDSRSALVQAAEIRLAERLSGLEAIEARIGALVDEKKALDDAQFAGLVGMYETMKPGAAADIFNNLDMEVLLRVSRSMNPRKMAPVLAKMATGRAQELTLMLAASEPEPALEEPLDDLTDLPQIVGQ